MMSYCIEHNRKCLGLIILMFVAITNGAYGQCTLLTAGTIQNDEEVCYGASPGTIDAGPAGVNTGEDWRILYQWQYWKGDVNGVGVWTDVGGGFSGEQEDYDPGPIYEDMLFRRRVGCTDEGAGFGTEESTSNESNTTTTITWLGETDDVLITIFSDITPADVTFSVECATGAIVATKPSGSNFQWYDESITTASRVVKDGQTIQLVRTDGDCADLPVDIVVDAPTSILSICSTCTDAYVTICNYP